MWLFFGWISVALGVIGLVLPIMPTVPFLIVAAFCFEKGSPNLHAWLIHHPRLGPPLTDWNENRVIRWRAKIIATVSLTISLGYTCFFSERPDWVKIVLGVVGVLAVTFILTRKSRI